MVLRRSNGTSCTTCGDVRESYDKSRVTWSSLNGGEFVSPQLDNTLWKTGWAPATLDQNQVSPRTVPSLIRV